MDEKLEAEILRKLSRHKYWGGRHTSIDNIPKSFKPHLTTNVAKTTKKRIREGFIICKPTSYGLHISLNPERSKEIKKKIRKYFTDAYLR